MQIPLTEAKQSLLRVFLYSMLGVAALFTLMAIGIWMSVTDVLVREKQLVNELLPELDVAHQLTSATAGLQSQGFLLRSAQTKTDLENRQNALELTIADIQQTLDTTTSTQSGVIKDLRQSMEGVADITIGLADARAQQIDSQQQVRQEIHAIHEALSDLEKDVQREVFALTGKLLSISNAMKLANPMQSEKILDKADFYARVSEYDDISLAIQDYLLLGRDIVSLHAVLEKVPLLTEKSEVVQALNKHDLLLRALISRNNYINKEDDNDTLLEHLNSVRTRLGGEQRLFALQNEVLTQELGQMMLYEHLQERTDSVLERTGTFRNDTRALVSHLAKETLQGLHRDRTFPMILSVIALLTLGAITYWLLYKKTVLPLLVITKQIDDVGSDRFPKTAPVYYLKEMSALSAAMMQLNTAQKKMQAQDLQLQGINKELKNVNEELQQFAHVASHDLQEPLRKMQQFSELLVEDYGSSLDENARYFIETIHLSSQRMSALIKETLAYSRSGSGNQALARVDLSQLIQQLRDEMDMAVDEADGEFIVDDMPVVLANELGMAQLFRNLMINGLKYRRPDVPAKIRITIDRHAGDAQAMTYIRVEDNGIGIQAQYLDRIFVPFERLNTSGVMGTGLGLAICKKVCVAHGWNLDVSSEPDQGTSFIIGIPKASVTG